MNAKRAQAVQLEDRRVQSALRQLKTGLRSLYGADAPAILVYGSYARGEATEGSDLDLLLLYPHPVNASREIMRLVALLADVNLEHQLLISTLPVSEMEYREAQGPFWRNVRREGALLRGD